MHFAYWWHQDVQIVRITRRVEIVNVHAVFVKALIRIVRAQLSLFKTVASAVIIKQPRTTNAGQMLAA